MDWLQHYLLNEDATLYEEEMALLLYDKFHVRYSQQQLSAGLKRRNLDRKKLEFVAAQQDFQQRQAFRLWCACRKGLY